MGIWPSIAGAEGKRDPRTQPTIQHNIPFEVVMTCDVAPQLFGCSDRTLITLCVSTVINFALPVLSCHADTKFTL